MSLPLPDAVTQEIHRLAGQFSTHREFVQTLVLVESRDELMSIVDGERFVQASSWVEEVKLVEVRLFSAGFRLCF